jgi:hypothetical protein
MELDGHHHDVHPTPLAYPLEFLSGEGKNATHVQGGRDWLIGFGLLALGLVLAAAFGVWKSWSAGTWLSALGLVTSIAGFSTALLEIRRTQHATKATRQAVNRTLRGVAASRLGIDIVRMRRLADEFESASSKPPMEDDQIEAVRRTLTDWRHLANEAKELAIQRFGGSHNSIEVLDDSIQTARDAKQKIFDGGMSSEDIAMALASMEKTLDALAPLLERIYPIAENDPHEIE